MTGCLICGADCLISGVDCLTYGADCLICEACDLHDALVEVEVLAALEQEGVVVSVRPHQRHLGRPLFESKNTHNSF